MRVFLAFPNPVNEKAARVVAGVVLAISVVILATGAHWLLIPLAYGFWARVLTGPTLSPLGWVAQNVIAPALGTQEARARPAQALRPGHGARSSPPRRSCSALVAGDDTAADAVLGAARRRRRPGVDLRLLPGLQGLRAADARRDSRERLR